MSEWIQCSERMPSNPAVQVLFRLNTGQMFVRSPRTSALHDLEDQLVAWMPIPEYTPPESKLAQGDVAPMNIYYGSGIAEKMEPNDARIELVKFCVTAKSHAESVSEALKRIREIYPEGAGWSYHSLEMFEITEEATLKVAADRYAKLTAGKRSVL